MNNDDEFYLGYLETCPPGIGQWLRRTLISLACLVIALLVLLAARQIPAEPGTFEFGVARTYEGVLYETPMSWLRSTTAAGGDVNYLLVGEGKQGLPAFARGHHGERVRFKGTLIKKGAARMLELNDSKSFMVLGPAATAEPKPAAIALGDVVLSGELVDTKCYFGVMRPATSKVHRACAVRCLSGGVPPGLLVRDTDGNGVVVVLTGIDGHPLRFDVEWAAREVRASGRLLIQGSIPRLEVRELSLVTVRKGALSP